jgi:hypothetical protein
MSQRAVRGREWPKTGGGRWNGGCAHLRRHVCVDTTISARPSGLARKVRQVVTACSGTTSQTTPFAQRRSVAQSAALIPHTHIRPLARTPLRSPPASKQGLMMTSTVRWCVCVCVCVCVCAVQDRQTSQNARRALPTWGTRHPSAGKTKKAWCKVLCDAAGGS